MKKLLSLALALALCLGLAVPAVIAADVSGLDTAAAQAYYKVLSEQIQEEGIRSSKEGRGIAYAALEDMDADGSPELIVLGFGCDWVLTIGIWSMKNGAAVQTFSDAGSIGAENGRVAFARKNGRIRLFYDYYWSYRAFEGRDLAMIDADGTCERSYYDTVEGGTAASPEEVTYDKTWVVDSTPILKVEDSIQWEYSAGQPQVVTALQSALLARANAAPAAAAGTYGPYTITGQGYGGTGYTISFDLAKVEEKTVQIRENLATDFDNGGTGGYSPYAQVKVRVVTLKPSTKVSVSVKSAYGGGVQLLEYGSDDGNGKYSMKPLCMAEIVTGQGTNAFLGMGNSSFARIYGKHTADGADYLLFLEGNAVSASAGFTDVKAGAYYADAVRWAVSGSITNGTSTTTFSPGRTCSTAEILTFLYRACGEPSQRPEDNPYTNVSSGNYYFGAALWAAKMGMVNGSAFPAGTPCSRANAVKFIWQAMGSPAPAKTARFTDVAPNASYAQAVSWAVGAGVTNGTSATTFSPDDTCTRGQIVTFLYRAMG